MNLYTPVKKILLILLVLGALVGAWYAFKSSVPAEETPAAPAAKIETVTVQLRPIAETLAVFGLVVPAPSGDRVTAAPYDCLVRRVCASVGTPVSAGDVLLEIEPSPDTKLACATARHALELAAKILAATQERFDLKLTTRTDLLAAQQAEKDARLKVESLQARGLDGDGRILASTSGVVTRLELGVGAFAPLGTVLVAVSAEGKLEARLGLEGTESGVVRPGQKVLLKPVHRSADDPVATVIRSVGATLDPVTGAVEARVGLPVDARLLLGEHVTARIFVRQVEYALVVPRNAVLPAGDQHVLYTVQAGHAVRHVVQPGIVADGFIEVAATDLHAGDTVVTLGNYELEDGMAVQVPAPAEIHVTAGGKP
jgi:RND family efflux transporter MFP subunit